MVACKLGTADLAAQRERWLALVERAGAGREETGDGLRLRFRAGPGVAEELEALARVERACCAWAAWDVEVVLHARSEGDGVAALHAMFR
jgi:hypothetical protein